MNITILDFAIIASVLMGYFISISLIATSFYKSHANRYFSLSVAIITSLTFLDWYDVNNSIVEFLIHFRLDYLFAVTFFTYFLIQIKHPFINSNRHKWLYLPFVLSAITEICMYSFSLYGSSFDIMMFYSKDTISIGFNTFLTLKGRSLVRKSKAISEDKRRWLLRLNLFFICIIVTWVLSRVELYVLNSENIIKALRVLLSSFLWWILYYGIFRLQVIVQKEEIHEYLVSKKPHNTYTKKKIKSTTTIKVITELYKLMEDEELYKDPLLSRLDLATRLDTNEGYLSQIINQEINKSVIQFVNEYRVEAAKNLLHNPVFNKYSIEAIGMEAGFKSKSAFYAAFNISLKMSPGAFRKLQKTS